MRNRFYIILSIISIAIFAVKYVSNLKSEIRENKLTSENLSDANTELLEIIRFQNHFNGHIIGVDNPIHDSLSKFLKNGPKLVLSFNQYSCEACVEYLLDWVNSSVSEAINKDDILFLVMIENEREAHSIKNRLDPEFGFIFVNPEESLSIDDEFKFVPPNAFIIDSSFIMYRFFIYSINFPEISDEYTEELKYVFN